MCIQANLKNNLLFSPTKKNEGCWKTKLINSSTCLVFYLSSCSLEVHSTGSFQIALLFLFGIWFHCCFVVFWILHTCGISY